MRKKIYLGALAVLAVYAVSPYWALYRLGAAVRDADTASLETRVDWVSVRQGIKDDFGAVMAARMSKAQAEGGENSGWAILGAAIGGKMVETMVDSMVTPAGLAVMLQEGRPKRAGTSQPASAENWDPDVEWAFFEGPASFSAEIKPPKHRAEPGRPPLRLRLELQGLTWKLTRLVLPMDEMMKD